MSNIFPFDGVKPQIGEGVFIAPNATVVGDVIIGENSSIWFNAVVRGDFAPIEIGKNVNIQDGVVVHAMNGEKTTIGDNVSIGHNTTIHCSSIGNNCLIGMGVTLLGFSEIGEGSIIGGGTIITQHKKIPPFSLVFGNPAKIIRHLRDDEIEAMKEAADGYSALAKMYAKELENL